MSAHSSARRSSPRRRRLVAVTLLLLIAAPALSFASGFVDPPAKTEKESVKEKESRAVDGETWRSHLRIEGADVAGGFEPGSAVEVERNWRAGSDQGDLLRQLQQRATQLRPAGTLPAGRLQRGLRPSTKIDGAKARRGENAYLAADTPMQIRASSRLDLEGAGAPNGAPIKSCGGAGYYIVTASGSRSETFPVGPYGSGDGYFGADTCSLPNPENDVFQQLWLPYNYGTAVLDVNPGLTPLWGSSCQLELARGIGAAIDIHVDRTPVYRVWGTDLDGGSAYHKPIEVTVTDSPVYHLLVHDDGDCDYLEEGEPADYALYGVLVPERSVELGVSSAYSTLLQNRGAIADPAAAVDQAGQWLGVAEYLVTMDEFLPPSRATLRGEVQDWLISQGLAAAVGAEEAEALLSLWDIVSIFKDKNLLGLVMGAWRGQLYDAVAYMNSIDTAELQTSQAYFVASVSTALSGVGQLLRDARPTGLIYTSRPADVPLGFFFVEADLAAWFSGAAGEWTTETPWPSLYWGSSATTASLGIAACCSSDVGDLAWNAVFAGEMGFIFDFVLPKNQYVAVPISALNTTTLISTAKLLNLFQDYEMAGWSLAPTETDYRAFNRAPAAGIAGALGAIFLNYYHNQLPYGAGGDGRTYGYDITSSAADDDTDGDGLSDLDEQNIHLTDPENPDHDGDGLSDGAEVALGRNPKSTGDRHRDSDGDGLSDLEELDRYGTDPAVAKNDIDYDGLSNAAEKNTHSTDPARADHDGDGLNDGDEVNVYGTNPRTLDHDGDGLGDGDEVFTYFTSPTHTDSDGDGLDDGDEVNVYGLDPNRTDSDGDGVSDWQTIEVVDSDGDGLSDWHETHTHGTDPALFDTDGDTLGDGLEVNTHGTDPLAKDSDGDGLEDADELHTHRTDPLLDDTDGDGLGDGDELATHGTDPLLDDTDGDGLDDGDEANVYGTNPLLDDTDGDGVGDGDEVAAGTDPLVDESRVTARCGVTTLFDRQGGNATHKAAAQVYVPAGMSISLARLTGQGHNQDAAGYARVMKVAVNGNVYTVISWLSNGQTKSFTYDLPAGVLQGGWNTVEAWIHWSNESYDAGHWVSVDLDLRGDCSNAGAGSTTLFQQAGGHSSDRPTRFVHVETGAPLSTVTLTGQGHNQDAAGYARVMKVSVNGSEHTVISWLSNGQTKSFTYGLPAGVLQPGWNTVQAWIHWSNASYDAGHWVSVDLTLQ